MTNDLDHRPLFRTSTDTAARSTSPSSPSSPTQTTPLPTTALSANEDKPKKLDLSATQLVGGALAAMTAAALGSRLGLAGTVIGAALASLVAGLGGALYTASLRRGRETVRGAWRGLTPRGSARSDTTTVTAVEAPSRYPGVPAAVAPALPAAVVKPTSKRSPRRWWPRVLIGAVASFGLAAGALTTVELLTGHALSGGAGTTIQQVQRTTDEPSGADQTDDGGQSDTTPEPAEPTPTAAPSASVEPSATPSPSATPTAGSGSAAPSATPTPEPTTPTDGSREGSGQAADQEAGDAQNG